MCGRDNYRFQIKQNRSRFALYPMLLLLTSYVRYVQCRIEPAILSFDLICVTHFLWVIKQISITFYLHYKLRLFSSLIYLGKRSTIPTAFIHSNNGIWSKLKHIYKCCFSDVVSSRNTSIKTGEALLHWVWDSSRAYFLPSNKIRVQVIFWPRCLTFQCSFERYLAQQPACCSV